MNGEDVFKAMVAADIADLAVSWTKADTGRVTMAIVSGTYRLLPKPLRVKLDAIADKLKPSGSVNL